MEGLQGATDLVAACGSIAAVKTPLLVSALVKAGAEVRCVVTRSAAELVSPVALATLSRQPCLQDADQWDAARPRPLHIELAEWSELVIVAPLSASSLARWVHGDGEGLLASLLLACECPVLAAAAMNTAMWQHPAVQRNWLSCRTTLACCPCSPKVGCWRVIALAPAGWRIQVRLNWLRPVSCCSRMPRHHRQRLARTPCGGECRSNPRGAGSRSCGVQSQQWPNGGSAGPGRSPSRCQR